MNGCGAEKMGSTTQIEAVNSRVSVNGGNFSEISTTQTETGLMRVDSSRVTVFGTNFRSFDGAPQGGERKGEIKNGGRFVGGGIRWTGSDLNHFIDSPGTDVAQEITFEGYERDNVPVVQERVTDPDLGNTPNTGDAATDDLINALANVVQSHGLGLP